jgi:hypothetical protein
MKKWAFFIVICLLSASNIFSQNLRWETDEEKSYQVPVGPCSWDDILSSDFDYLIKENSMNIILNPKATVALAEVLEAERPTKYEIDAYFGAWDDESLWQLPRFYVFAITMESKYQQSIDFQFYGCNREYDCGCKTTPESMPYFMVYKVTPDGQRTLIGKISEKPEVSFEDDVLKMIKN